MSQFDVVYDKLEAAKTTIEAAKADLQAMEEIKPPVEPPIELPVEPPVEQEPEMPKGVSLRPIALLDTKDWPVGIQLISDIDETDTTLVSRIASDAEGRFALLAFEPPNGKILPGTEIVARFNASIDAPGGSPCMFVEFFQGEEKFAEQDVAIRHDGLRFYNASAPSDALPDPERSDNVYAKWGFRTNVPEAKKYFAGGIRLYVEHDNSGSTKPTEPEPTLPPSNPAGTKLIYSATPQIIDLTSKASEIDKWFRDRIGAGFIGEANPKGLALAQAPDGRPAMRLSLNPNDARSNGFQIRRNLNGLNARRAVISCDMYIPSKLRWRTKPGIKFIGLSNGKSVGQGNSYPPDQQEGQYSRIIFWLPDDLSDMYFGLYHYARNRKENPDKQGKYWGSQYNSKIKAPRNRWFTIEHELILNTPGKANGVLSAILDGKTIIQLTGQDLQPAELGLRDAAYLWMESKKAKSENGEIYWTNFQCYTD